MEGSPGNLLEDDGARHAAHRRRTVDELPAQTVLRPPAILAASGRGRREGRCHRTARAGQRQSARQNHGRGRSKRGGSQIRRVGERTRPKVSGGEGAEEGDRGEGEVGEFGGLV